MPDCVFGYDKDNQPICATHKKPLMEKTLEQKPKYVLSMSGGRKVNIKTQVWVCSESGQRVNKP
jgi:hypothetical protein